MKCHLPEFLCMEGPYTDLEGPGLQKKAVVTVKEK